MIAPTTPRGVASRAPLNDSAAESSIVAIAPTGHRPMRRTLATAALVVLFAAPLPEGRAEGRAETPLTGLGAPSGTLTPGASLPPPVTRGRPRPRIEKPLRLGLVAPVRPEIAMDRIEPFRRRLAETLAGEVKAVTFADERLLIEALASGRVDYARLTATGYATAWTLCGCVEPLVAPRAADGTAGFRAAVVTRTGSPLAGLGDLAGRTLAISTEPALATRRLPLMVFAREGLTGERAPKLVEVAGPTDAVRALLAGRAEAAVVWSTLEGDPTEGWGRGTLHDLAARGEVSMPDIRVLWSSQVLPHGPQVVRANLDEGRKRRLRDMLIDLDEVDPDAYEAIEPLHAGGFLRIGHPAYVPWLPLVAPPPQPPSAPGTTTGSTPPG